MDHISYLVQAHSFCLNLAEFPLNLEICIEHLSHGRLKIELRPNFHSWGNRRYQVVVVWVLVLVLVGVSFWSPKTFRLLFQ